MCLVYYILPLILSVDALCIASPHLLSSAIPIDTNTDVYHYHGRRSNSSFLSVYELQTSRDADFTAASIRNLSCDDVALNTNT